MKVQASVAAAVLAVGAAAQSSPASISYTTVTYNDCPNASLQTMITVTNGVTVTYCPTCTGAAATPTTGMAAGTGYTTIYTTTYMSLCPTGLVPVTYTVTESCTDAKPTWTPGPSYVPNGFTVTVKECTVCDKSQSKVTITEPCHCEATGGVPVPAASNPVQQISDGQVQVPTGGAAPGGSKSSGPAPTGAAASTPCNGSNCGAAANGNTKPSSSACNGTSCGAAANGNTSPGGSPAVGSAGLPLTTKPLAPGGASTTSASGTVPFKGDASSLVSHNALAASVVFAVVGGLAILL